MSAGSLENSDAVVVAVVVDADDSALGFEPLPQAGARRSPATTARAAAAAEARGPPWCTGGTLPERS